MVEAVSDIPWETPAYTRRQKVKKQVTAEIASIMDEAVENGLDPIEYAMKTFVTVPEAVIMSAWAEWQAADIEKWWQSLERTIDAEIVRRALEADRD